MNGLILLPTRLCEAYVERRRTTPRKRILLDIESAIFQLIAAGYKFPIRFYAQGSEANHRRIERHLAIFENESELTPERMRFFWCFYPALVKALPEDLKLKVIADCFGALGVGVYAAVQMNRSDLVDLAKSLNKSMVDLNACLFDSDIHAIAHLASMQQALSQFRNGIAA